MWVQGSLPGEVRFHQKNLCMLWGSKDDKWIQSFREGIDLMLKFLYAERCERFKNEAAPQKSPCSTTGFPLESFRLPFSVHIQHLLHPNWFTSMSYSCMTTQPTPFSLDRKLFRGERHSINIFAFFIFPICNAWQVTCWKWALNK